MIGLRLPVMLTGLLWTVVIAITLKPTNVWPATPVHGYQAQPAAYLEALQTANAFLWAWLIRDAEEGLRLMSDHLRTQIHDEAWLRQFVVGPTRTIKHSRYVGVAESPPADMRFRSLCYELYTGERVGTRYRGILKVEKQGDIWRVNRLPISPGIR